MFLTAQLIFVIIMVAVEKHKSTYLAPVAIGVTFFLCELIGMCWLDIGRFESAVSWDIADPRRTKVFISLAVP